jgi:hypothetical protein
MSVLTIPKTVANPSIHRSAGDTQLNWVATRCVSPELAGNSPAVSGRREARIRVGASGGGGIMPVQWPGGVAGQGYPGNPG